MDPLVVCVVSGAAFLAVSCGFWGRLLSRRVGRERHEHYLTSVRVDAGEKLHRD